MPTRCAGPLQLAQLALESRAAAGVRESAALALARLSLLNKYKVTDVIAALCRCLLADSSQVTNVTNNTELIRVLLAVLKHDQSRWVHLGRQRAQACCLFWQLHPELACSRMDTFPVRHGSLYTMQLDMVLRSSTSCALHGVAVQINCN